MFKSLLYDFVSEGKRILIEDFVSILPDIAGYSAIACGAFIMIAPMIGQDILKPLGIFLTIGICCVSILGAV